MNTKQINDAFIKLGFFIVISVLLTACGQKKSLVFVLDYSDSVSANARAESLKAIQLQAKTLGRGDSITVIPVTGDAAVETGGKVLRLEAGEIRRLRDRDLKDFQAEIEQKINLLSGAATYKQTDLLGALRIAQEEAANQRERHRRVIIVILSDLVHSTSQIRFEQNAGFAKPESVRPVAEKMSQTDIWRATEIYLGSLESSDLRKMPTERRQAVGEFWRQYFTIGGAARFQAATDGAGQLANFIEAGQITEDN